MRHALALYGRDHTRYGFVHTAPVGPRIAAAISVGADPHSPSHRFKADPDRPNEDALYVRDTDRRCLIAVADSHFGHRASHALIDRIAALPAIPTGLDALRAALDGLGGGALGVDDESSSTLCLAVYDRQSRSGFGLGVGDSTVTLVGPDRAPAALNRHTRAYIHPARDPRPARRAEAFTFTAPPGALLLAFTDGVDECHYRRPETSIGPGHLRALFDEIGPEARAYADALARLALTGVDGNPGGQDNIAIVAART